MPTIKEIAQLAGVSRGTVDRVLNKRGYVDPKKEKKVLEIAKALKYSPNLAGKTLAIKKKNLRIGYILFSSTSSNPFFIDVVDGIEKRAAELREYNVSVDIRYTGVKDPKLQVEQINQLIESGISGLAITPINHSLIIERIRELTSSGFPVVTVNSDIAGSGRLAYVGSNYYKSGETAAGIINLICAGKSKAGILMGSQLVLCQTERVEGFTNRICEAYRGIEIAAIEENNDDDILSYAVTKRLIERHPEIDSLFLVSAGVLGACRAVTELGLSGKLKVVCNDATIVSRELIESGSIAAAITQEPFYQGTKPLDILFNYIGMDVEPDKEYYYTELGIMIKENL